MYKFEGKIGIFYFTEFESGRWAIFHESEIDGTELTRKDMLQHECCAVTGCTAEEVAKHLA